MDTVTDRAFAAALYNDGDDGLDTGASLLAAAPEADRELAGRGEDFLRRTWQRGWQPADVVRLVRRDLAERHVRLLAALIVSELRAYDTLPPRWQSQLAGLDTSALRADRFSQATAVLELYRLLLRLPALEPVGPAPGATTLVPPPHHAEPRFLSRIRALLAKAEGTDYPAEAEALSAKAQDLMARHSIDEARLSADGRPEVPGARRIGIDAPYESAKAVLLDAVATANRCRAVWNGAFGFSTVVGFESDLEVVELLHTSLLVQGTAAMTRAEAAQRAGGRRRTKTFRQSFLMAYASRVGDRLAETTGQVTAETAGPLLPVLAARDVAVTSEAERMFPRTTVSRIRGGSVTDEAGWTDGTAAADAARVDGRANTGLPVPALPAHPADRR